MDFCGGKSLFYKLCHGIWNNHLNKSSQSNSKILSTTYGATQAACVPSCKWMPLPCWWRPDALVYKVQSRPSAPLHPWKDLSGHVWRLLVVWTGRVLMLEVKILQYAECFYQWLRAQDISHGKLKRRQTGRILRIRTPRVKRGDKGTSAYRFISKERIYKVHKIHVKISYIITNDMGKGQEGVMGVCPWRVVSWCRSWELITDKVFR